GGSQEGNAPLQPWTATSLDEAWTYLMRERAIQLWLESRRFTDQRRCETYIVEYGKLSENVQTNLELSTTLAGTAAWPDFEAQMVNPQNNLFTSNFRGRSAIEDQNIPREYCYNISNTERQNNPNFDEDTEP